MARAKNKEKRTQEQIDKQKHFEQVQQELQKMCDAHKYQYMSEIMKAWNAKNKDKVKAINDRFYKKQAEKLASKAQKETV